MHICHQEVMLAVQALPFAALGFRMLMPRSALAVRVLMAAMRIRIRAPFRRAPAQH